ncbi:MAG: MoaD family protein [Caldilineaceae bacterium]|nr:MoaD family protein [Caldilineaceae bacterium]
MASISQSENPRPVTSSVSQPGGQPGPQVTVRIPAQIRRLYGSNAHEMLDAASVADLVAQLDARYPGMGERLMEPSGQLRRWVNVFVQGDDVRSLQGVDTPLQRGDEVWIVPSVAGG